MIPGRLHLGPCEIRDLNITFFTFIAEGKYGYGGKIVKSSIFELNDSSTVADCAFWEDENRKNGVIFALIECLNPVLDILNNLFSAPCCISINEESLTVSKVGTKNGRVFRLIFGNEGKVAETAS